MSELTLVQKKIHFEVFLEDSRISCHDVHQHDVMFILYPWLLFSQDGSVRLYKRITYATFNEYARLNFRSSSWTKLPWMVNPFLSELRMMIFSPTLLTSSFDGIVWLSYPNPTSTALVHKFWWSTTLMWVIQSWFRYHTFLLNSLKVDDIAITFYRTVI
jgi:hypothetical protein